MRSARKTKASWRSGARPRSAGAEGRAGLVEVERAEHVLVEVAVLAAGGLRLRHVRHPTRPGRRSPGPNPQNGRFSVCRNFQGRSPGAPAPSGFSGGDTPDPSGWRRHGAGHRSHRLRRQPPAAPPGRRGPARARAGAPARARGGARRRRGRAPATCSRGDGPRRARSTACTTAYYLVHSMEAAAGDGDGFADRDRRAAEALRRARPPTPASSGSSTSAASSPPRGAVSRPPAARGSRWSEILLDAVPRLHRAARLDRDRRRLVLVSHPRAARRAAARAAAAGAGASNRTQPIAERDVIEYLARTPAVPDAAGPIARRRRART